MIWDIVRYLNIVATGANGRNCRQFRYSITAEAPVQSAIEIGIGGIGFLYSREVMPPAHAALLAQGLTPHQNHERFGAMK
jgi:hypothetical protein